MQVRVTDLAGALPMRQVADDPAAWRIDLLDGASSRGAVSRLPGSSTFRRRNIDRPGCRRLPIARSRHLPLMQRPRRRMATMLRQRACRSAGAVAACIRGGALIDVVVRCGAAAGTSHFDGWPPASLPLVAPC